MRLSALWAATMFCYVYGDYFGLFLPGQMMEMNAGIMGPLGPATPGILVAVSTMMAVPSLMIFLSLILPALLNRWLNIFLGLIYSGIILLTMPGSPHFYLFLAIIEVALTVSIVFTAWTWPRRHSEDATTDAAD
jgi:hypothetical protein